MKRGATLLRRSGIAISALVSLVLATPAGAAFPGRNGQLAGEGWWNDASVLVRVYADGFAPRPLGEPGERHEDPVYSPSGRWIAYAASVDGGLQDIFVARWDGADVQNLTSSPEAERFPAWSPDGRWIAYAGDGGIWRIRPDGTDKRLIAPQWPNGPMSWSPIGDKLLFVSNREPNYNETVASHDVWTVSVEGARYDRVTDTATNEFDPEWSPDGTRIVFGRWIPDNNGREYVMTMDADGTDVRRLRPGSEPTFSPNGRLIAYLGNGVRVMRADGTRDRALGMDDVGVYGLGNPTWQPWPGSRRSAITMRVVAQSEEAIAVRGRVEPAHPRQEVVLSLYRWRDGARRLVERTRWLTGRSSAYHGGVGRYGDRACVLRARFVGDPDHLPAVASARVRC